MLSVKSQILIIKMVAQYRAKIFHQVREIVLEVKQIASVAHGMMEHHQTQTHHQIMEQVLWVAL